jgi:hypothetical protein
MRAQHARGRRCQSFSQASPGACEHAFGSCARHGRRTEGEKQYSMRIDSSPLRALTEGTSHRRQGRWLGAPSSTLAVESRGVPARGCLVEAVGATRNRAQAKRRKAHAPWVSRSSAAKPKVCWSVGCIGDGIRVKFCVSYPGNRVDGHLRRRLRALILKQWKRKRHIVNRLKQMGVPAPLAHVDVNARRRSWWSLSKVRAVCRGLDNEYFEQRGLYGLYAHWHADHERIWDIGLPPPARQRG